MLHWNLQQSSLIRSAKSRNMSTKHIWKAIATYEKIFQKYSSFPFQFNSRKKCIYQVKKQRKLKAFIFGLFIQIFQVLTNFSCSLGKFLNVVPFNKIQAWIVIFEIVLLVFTLCMLLGVVLLLTIVDFIPAAFDAVLKMETELRKSMPPHFHMPHFC